MANPNPSPETRFGAERGNEPKGGKTSEQRRAEYQAAEHAAFIREKMLSVIKEKIDAGEDPLQFIDPATLKLFKDSEDRAHGTPRQAVDHTSSDGSMSPKAIDATKLSDEVLQALIEAADGNPDDE